MDSLSYEVCCEIKKHSLGRYKGWANQKRRSFSNPVATNAAQILHQSRHGQKDLPAAMPWPEVALIGHSNCGKSALVNVLAAKQAKRGVAGVSDRAGWTEAINFYKLQLWSKEGPSVMLVDMPGYGLAVADKRQQDNWKAANNRYLCKRDPSVLRAVILLVDSTRGLCAEDKQLLSRLDNANRPYFVALTKVDLLQQDELAACNALLMEELQDRPMLQRGQHGGLLMVSSLHGQGIHEMWRFLMSDTLRMRKPKMVGEEDEQDEQEQEQEQEEIVQEDEGGWGVYGLGDGGAQQVKGGRITAKRSGLSTE
jgi:GTP-binding protein